VSDTPDRSITGLVPRGATPDFSRLQRRNRVVQESTHLDGPDGEPAPTPVSAPTPGVALATPALQTQARAVPAAGERERVTTYLDGRLRSRAREAYRATSHLEGDKSWSDFVERAILAEVQRREAQHNDGRTYTGDQTPLSPGRPLK
jgi:hypothetical protein